MPSPPAPLDWLLNRLARLVATATDALEAEYPNGIGDWQQEVSRQLARYHGAAMLAATGAPSLTPEMTTAVTTDLATQLRFLDKFAIVMQDEAEWQAGWQARAEMYARSIQVPYNRGITRLYALPAMPGDGTSTCLTNCTCYWEIDELDGDGNADCYWRMGAAEHHCQTCPQRAQDWAPIRVREGVVQLG